MSLVTNTNDIFTKGVIGNVRKAQEDSHDWALKTPNGDVFVVCDGMGGHVGGAKASSLAVESIISYLKAEKYTDPQAALNGALQFANMQILGFAAANPGYKGMGTTACIVLLQSDEAYIAHVGDSRIYLYLGKEKELHRITKDHSYVQSLVDKGIIDDDQAETHSQKNRILKALGVTPNLEPTFNKAKPKNGDIFLICSDGLSGMIPDSTIENVLGQNSTLDAKGELLINLAMQGETVQPGGQDNCTLELIQIDNSPWPKSEFTSYNPSKSRKKRVKKSHSKIITIVAITIAALIVALGIAGLYVRHEINKTKNGIEIITKEINKSEKVINDKNEELEKTKAELEKAEKSHNEESIIKRTKVKKTIERQISDETEKKHEKEILLGKLKEKLNKLYKIYPHESSNNRKK